MNLQQIDRVKRGVVHYHISPPVIMNPGWNVIRRICLQSFRLIYGEVTTEDPEIQRGRWAFVHGHRGET
jgi:hypothetical protein